MKEHLARTKAMSAAAAAAAATATTAATATGASVVSFIRVKSTYCVEECIYYTVCIKLYMLRIHIDVRL